MRPIERRSAEPKVSGCRSAPAELGQDPRSPPGGRDAHRSASASTTTTPQPPLASVPRRGGGGGSKPPPASVTLTRTTVPESDTSPIRLLFEQGEAVRRVTPVEQVTAVGDPCDLQLALRD